MPSISKTQLIKLQKSLKTDAAIGEKYGITRQAIHQFRKQYGIPSLLAKNDARNANILSLYKKGIPGTKIAKKVGLCISQTYRIIKKAPKKVPAKKKTK
jgi:DNA invertase Pin-like site-specific DNA recombinase